MDNLANVVKYFLDIELIKLGNFTLHSGKTSAIYFDLRQLISYPTLLKQVIELYLKLPNNYVKPDLVCGVAYTGIPMATVYSQLTNLPMIIRRKEPKNYGTEQLIEGRFRAGNHVVLIDDVITSGDSLLETAIDLEKNGLKISVIQVLIDRRPISERTAYLGGKYLIQSVFTIEMLLRLLVSSNVTIPIELKPLVHRSFKERSFITTNLITKKIFTLISEKKSNLILSVDLPKKEDVLYLADLVGPEISVLKLHIDTIQDVDEIFIQTLIELAAKHKFLLFEDRKYADIGEITKNQYKNMTSSWADLITCHMISGTGILDAIREVNQEEGSKPCGVLLIAQMSSQGNLISAEYTKHVTQIALQYPDLVTGVICQEALIDDRFIHMTPGVNLAKNGDDLGQQYHTPESVIKAGSDMIIVGRGITQATNKLEAAQQYRKKAWDAYVVRKTSFYT